MAISREFEEAAKDLSPAAHKTLDDLRASAASGVYGPAAKFISKLGGTEVNAGQIEAFVKMANIPKVGLNLLAQTVETEVNKGRNESQKISITSKDVAFFKTPERASTSQIIALVSKISGDAPSDIVNKINAIAGGGGGIAETAEVAEIPESAATVQEEKAAENNTPPAKTETPADKNKNKVASLTATAAAPFAQQTPPEDTQPANTGNVQLSAQDREKREEQAQKERAQVEKILKNLEDRKTKGAEQAGGLLQLAAGQIGNVDIKGVLESPGMAEARKRGVKIAENGMGLFQMASFFVSSGALHVPVGIVESVRERMLTEFRTNPRGALDEMIKNSDPKDAEKLTQFKTALDIVENTQNPDEAAEILSGLTKRVIGADHVNTLKRVLKGEEDDNDTLLETLLVLDPSVNAKLDEQAALIGGGMMKQYLSNPGMLIDQIFSTLKEMLPGFSEFFDSISNTVKGVAANFGFGSTSPSA